MPPLQARRDRRGPSRRTRRRGPPLRTRRSALYPPLTAQPRLRLFFSVPPALAAHGRLPEWPKGAVCKTVGSAYVGSNPTPATYKPRSEPVTLVGVTGFRRERERLR